MTPEQALNPTLRPLQAQLHTELQAFLQAPLSLHLVGDEWVFMHAANPHFSGTWPMGDASSLADLNAMRLALAQVDALTQTAQAAVRALGHTPEAGLGSLMFQPQRVQVALDLLDPQRANLKALVTLVAGQATDIEVFDAVDDADGWWDSEAGEWVPARGRDSSHQWHRQSGTTHAGLARR